MAIGAHGGDWGSETTALTTPVYSLLLSVQPKDAAEGNRGDIGQTRGAVSDLPLLVRGLGGTSDCLSRDLDTPDSSGAQ